MAAKTKSVILPDPSSGQFVYLININVFHCSGGGLYRFDRPDESRFADTAYNSWDKLGSSQLNKKTIGLTG